MTSSYPDTYNHEGIEERHPNAQRGKPRCTSHDQYSIIYIIKHSDIPLMEEDQNEKLEDMEISLWKRWCGKLSDLLSDFLKC